MSCTVKHYIGEIGTRVLVDVKSDISVATVTDLKVKKPDGKVVIWPGNVYGANNDFIRYVTVAGDFSVAGIYKLQAVIESPTWTGPGNTDEFEIFGPFG